MQHTDNLEVRLSETSIANTIGLSFASRNEVFKTEKKLKKWTRLKREILIYKG